MSRRASFDGISIFLVTLPYMATLTKISVSNTGYYGKMTPVETMQDVPLWAPPYGRIKDIDLNTTDHPGVVTRNPADP